MFRYVEPEVAGGMGDKTVLDASSHPPLVHRLHYQFDGWLGDDILETFPCYIVTERLKQGIEGHDLTGVIFDNVIVSRTKTFDKLYPGILLPEFYWLKVIGIPRKDDFSISEDYRMVISDEAFTLLKNFNISNANLEFE